MEVQNPLHLITSASYTIFWLQTKMPEYALLTTFIIHRNSFITLSRNAKAQNFNLKSFAVHKPNANSMASLSLSSSSPSSSSREYVSVMPLIFTGAGAAPQNLTYEDIDKKVWAIYEDICRHSSTRGREALDEEGKKWLTELLAWEMFFPNDKDLFPGVCPQGTNTSQPKALEANGLPFCECCACLGWKQGTSLCPFIRTTKCASNHTFKYRIGTSIPICPTCNETHLDSEWTFIHQTEPKEPQIKEEDWLAVGKNEGVGDDWVEYEDDPKAKNLREYRRTVTYCRVQHYNKKWGHDFAKVREASKLKQEEQGKKRRENILLRMAKRELFGTVLEEAKGFGATLFLGFSHYTTATPLSNL
ncbi:hypothetical protein BDZ45DRAFT_748929 [Acephala macrosclerotiorum]|nr:hypothetical protein BDZ45DRAFT_748929 [Acephala macrosclerotiorum]